MFNNQIELILFSHIFLRKQTFKKKNNSPVYLGKDKSKKTKLLIYKQFKLKWMRSTLSFQNTDYVAFKHTIKPLQSHVTAQGQLDRVTML